MVFEVRQVLVELLAAPVRPEPRAKTDAMAFEVLPAPPAHLALLEQRAPREIQAWLGAMA